jgi:hypothetical protein
LYAPVWASNQWVSNLFISKNFQMVTQNSKINLRLTSSIRNLLNASIPSLNFEQSRYDYKNFSLQKFSPKYIYDLGRTYTVGLQVSML